MYKKVILVFVTLISFAVNAQIFTKHKVVKGETITQIAQKYNCTPSEIYNLNPDAQNGIQLDALLVIPIGKTTVYSNNTHIVAAKETLYSISKLYSMSVEEIQNANLAILSEGLKVGQNLVIPIKSATNLLAAANKPRIDKPLMKLTKSTSSSPKELVFLLPFNISKIEGDTINTIPSKLKKDKFLNMTLDFYSGVLMAIDSAKTIGLNINIKIYDSEETKNTSSIPSLIQQNKFQSANAIIGPFYQLNIEKLSQSLGSNSVPILSPLSKETGKSSSTIYQSMPSNENCKAAMINYIGKNNGNLVALIDTKKASLKDFLKSNNYKNKIVGLTPTGLVVKDSLRKLLVRNKMNYIILDSQKTGFILAATNAMISLMTDYQLQMVILEPNPTLDFYEIDLNRLVKLKMMYPSIVRENLSPEAELFRNKYKKINKIFPNQFAVRGFDLAFDTMMRLSQEEDFKTVSENYVTEQIENRFNYSKNSLDTYSNKGIYILNYESDLTLKQASE
ncbi:MAG: LysM peptidoglycan-binding domain-containing protein [Flavobacterium sp.]|nr:LysM peptidoglycan-binding domain-containing protein [Flavobacterium sp.]